MKLVLGTLRNDGSFRFANGANIGATAYMYIDDTGAPVTTQHVVIDDNNGIPIIYSDVGGKLDILHTDTTALQINLVSPGKISFNRANDNNVYSAGDLI